MKTFYSLSYSAGLIRSNKFLDKADAVCVGSFRARETTMPVKIFEHKDEPGNSKCILICNPDGSVAKPKGAGYKEIEDQHNSTARNFDQANLLLSSYKDEPVTVVHLKNQMSEAQAKQISSQVEFPVGMYDADTLLVYSHSDDDISTISNLLSSIDVEVSRVSRDRRGQKVQASTEVSARTGEKFVSSCAVRMVSKGPKNWRIQTHAISRKGQDGRESIEVFVDGRSLGSVKDEAAAKRLVSEEVQRSFATYCKKNLG